MYVCEQCSNGTELLQINILIALQEPVQVLLLTISLLSNQRTLLGGFGKVMASRGV